MAASAMRHQTKPGNPQSANARRIYLAAWHGAGDAYVRSNIRASLWRVQSLLR
jgi:hypothetical protein